MKAHRDLIASDTGGGKLRVVGPLRDARPVDPSGIGVLATAAATPGPDEPAGLPAAARASWPRVVVGIRDLAFHQEVLDCLQRDPRIEVVAAVDDPGRALEVLGERSVHVLVVCPKVAQAFAHPGAAGRPGRLLVVAEELSVPVLRTAIDAGAHAVFAWPDEREDLVRAIVHRRDAIEEGTAARGTVVAVLGARGGAGTTFLATHLAALFGRSGDRTALVDLDNGFADVTVALGLGPDDVRRTMADLVPVADELVPDHVEEALYRHPAGFSVLLAPGEPGTDVPPGLSAGVVALLACSNDTVLVHMPRAVDDTARRLAGMADLVLLVVGLDLFSLFGARRIIAALRLDATPGRMAVVVNRAMGGEVTPSDVARVLGVTPVASIGFDPAVRRAQDRGQLVSARSRHVGRDLRKLAAALTRGTWASSPSGRA